MHNYQLPIDFSGSMGLYYQGQEMNQVTRGYRDLPNKTPNNIDTLFGVASAGKAFVAVGIMKLVENRMIRLEQTLGSLLGSELGKVQTDITVHELLTHTSGIQDYFDEEELSDYAELWHDFPNYRIRKNQDLYPLFFDKPLDPDKRGRFIYNNSGYVMLAAIIEKITGQPFDDYLAQVIFKPAEMNRTGYYELDRLPRNVATAYVFDPLRKEYFSNMYSIDAKGSGAGGVFTTILDIHQFWKALNSEVILSKEFVKQLFTVQLTDNQEFYGLGFWLKQVEPSIFIPYFEGMDPGSCFYSEYDFHNEIELTLISNQENNVWKIANDIKEKFKDNQNEV